jgi:hypothetical protein
MKESIIAQDNFLIQHQNFEPINICYRTKYKKSKVY